jgi:hypothetical protein
MQTLIDMVHRFTMTFQIQVSPLLFQTAGKKNLSFVGSSRAGPCVPQVQDDQAGQLDAVLRM